jgi:hypothetical protein
VKPCPYKTPKAIEEYAKYKLGLTVGELLDAVYPRRWILWDRRHGHITLESPDGGMWLGRLTFQVTQKSVVGKGVNVCALLSKPPLLEHGELPVTCSNLVAACGHLRK